MLKIYNFSCISLEFIHGNFIWVVYAYLMAVMSRIISKPVIIGATCTAMVLLGTSVYVWHENQRPPILEIYVIPLKSGQALFIRTPSDKRILVDGGTNSEIIRHISDILPFYSRHIDTVMVTRTDGVHTSGLIDVIERYGVGEIVIPGVSLGDLGSASSTDQIYETFIETVERLKIPIKKVVAGDKLVFDKGVLPVVSGILFPVATSTLSVNLSSSSISSSPKNFAYSKASAPELVFNISYGSTSIMVIGSVTPKIQKFIVSTSSISNAMTSLMSDIDVLVTSKTPITSNLAPVFLEKYSPANIVYSKVLTKAKTDYVTDNTSAVSSSTTSGTMFNIREVGVVKIVSDGKHATTNKSL